MSKGSDSSGKTSAQSSFLPIQKTAMTQALQSFMDQSRVGSGQTSFEGDRLAPFTTGQQQALSGVDPFIDIFSAQREIPFLGETGGALQKFLSGEFGAGPIGTDRANEIFDVSRQQPAEQTFDRFTRPLVEEQFAGPNFQSSARANAVTREGEFLQQGLRGERGAFLGQTEAFNRGLEESKANRALSAIPMGAQLAGLPTQLAQQQLSGLGSAFGFLGAQQQQQQQEINVAQQVFQEAQRFMDPEDFSILASLLGIPFQQKAETSGGGGGLLGSLMPAIGTAAGTAFGGPVGAAAGGALGSLFSK